MSLRTSHTSIGISSRIRTTVHPCVRQDLAQTKYIPLYAWTQSVLGLSEKDIDERAAHIRRLRWFADPLVREGLVEFCSIPPDATHEKARYDPFAAIVNRAFELAKRELPGIPSSYPIDDICLIRNDPKCVQCIPEHGKLGAQRSPDLLFVRGAQATKLRGSKTARVRWVDILGWSEFKASEKDVIELLNRQRKEYGLSIIDKETLKSRQPTPQSTPPKTLPLTPPGPAFASSSTSAPGIPGKPENKSPPAGTKRPRNSLDSRDEASKDDSGSGIKRKTLDYSETHGRADAKVQSGGYALEAAACTYGTRSSCLGIVLDNDVMSLWYYDAAGYVSVNQCLSLLADFEKVVAIFVGFACLGHERWGAIPSVISPPTSAPYPTNFPPESLNDHSFVLPRRLNSKQMVRVTLTEPCFTQYNLVGRRTFLYDIKTDTVISKKPLVVKLSYQVVTRKREDQLLTRAKKAKVGHLPEFHLWGDLWNMSDGIRQIFYDTSSRLSEDERGVATYEDRTLRALVYTKYLPLKTLFSESCELIPVMVDQILDCLHDLRYKANILHRDVSCNNIMYDIRRGKVHFILIDYDLATVVTDDGEPSAVASSKHRTGTLPFMAYELLLDMHNNSIDSNSPRVMHYLRHDYESLLYVSLWCAVYIPPAANDEQREIFITYLQTWETGTIQAVGHAKEALFSHNIGSLPLPPSAAFLRPFFTYWIALFAEAYITSVVLRNKAAKAMTKSQGPQLHTYNLETFNGLITRDAIKQELAEAMAPPEPSDDKEGLLPVGDAEPVLGNLANAQMNVDREDSHTEATLPEETCTVETAKSIMLPIPDKTPTLPKAKVTTRRQKIDKAEARTRTTRKVNTARVMEEVAPPKKAPVPRNPRIPKASTRVTRSMITRSMVRRQ